MSTTKAVTGLTRFSFVNVWEPKAMSEGDTPKYSVSIIIPKSDVRTIKKVKEAIQAAFEQGINSKFGGKEPVRWKNPLRDGDEEKPESAEYANAYFINANSLNKPGIVDKDVNTILDQEEIYSGVYGRASINFYPFNFNGSKGVAAGLNGLQKLKDGDRLSGANFNAEEDFGDGFDDFDDDDLMG